MRNNRGHLIIAALIGIAITALGFIGIIQMMKTGLYAQRNIQGKNDMSNLNDTLNLILKNPDLCKNAFWNSATPEIASFNPDDTTLPLEKQLSSIRLGTATVLSIGSQVGVLTITTMALTESETNARQVSGASTVYVATLSITATKPRSFGSPSLASAYPIYVETDNSTHQIIACGKSLSPLPPGGGDDDRTMCGITPSSYNGGQMGGLAGVKAKCEAVSSCGIGANICSLEELSRTTAAFLSLPAGSRLWAHVGFNNCVDWTTGSSEVRGSVIVQDSDSPPEPRISSGEDGCEIPHPIACCNVEP